jgi:hypothetical protein
MIAYHFISEKYALDVVSDQCLKLSLFTDLNDPFELLASDLQTPELRQEAIRFKDFMSSKYGILCFSENWKNPLLWSHYADKHKGVALEFSIKDEIALPVNYRQNRFKINFQAKKDPKTPVTKREIEGLWLTKYISWNYEEEIRVICSQNKCFKKDGLLFYPLNNKIVLEGIILGPLCDTTIPEIKERVPKNMNLKVVKSRLAFRSFNIVEQKQFEKVTIKI